MTIRARPWTAGIDMLSLSGGMSVFFRPGHTEAGYFAELSAAAKKGTTLPVLLTGGIADGAEAEAFLEKGQADLIGIGRAALRDHQIYQKILLSLQFVVFSEWFLNLKLSSINYKL